jgi:hypothetical protein
VFKYFFWVSIGTLCGAALGIIFPVGMYAFIIWTEGENAHGVGTPLSLLTILTVPAGALLGGYAGMRRAQTGRWTNTWSISTNRTLPTLAEIIALKFNFPKFEQQLSRLPKVEAARERQIYVRRIRENLESMEFNYGLLSVWILVGLTMPILLIVPALITIRYYLTKRMLGSHLTYLNERWKEDRIIAST